MQPQQSDIESNNKRAAATTTTTSQQPLPTTATPTTTATNQQQQQQNRKHHHQHNHHHHHRSPKIIKGKKPLIHFKFYLDIRDHQLTKSIEEKITSLGGCLEFFLTSSITHFVTDKQIQTSINNNNNNTSSKNNNNSRPLTPQTPQTPGTPLTPYSPYEQSPGGIGDSTKNVGSGNAAFGSATATKIKKQSRADAMLNRVRRPSTTTTTATIYENSNYNNNNNNTYINNQKSINNKSNNSSLVITAKPNYIIWTPEYALRFFKRLTHDLKDYLVEGGGGASKKLNGANKPAGGTVEPISLKGGFIKIEAIKRNQRPYYQLFRKPTEWPKIELNREDGAFRLSPKRKPEPVAAELVVNLEPKKMTRKSRSRSSHNRTDTKDGGVQALKKNAAEITKSNNGRLKANSNNADVGAVAAAAAAACKQLKETSEKQCGVCEICKIEYDTLTIHLKTKDHEYFAKNTQNFIALDTLIHASANVNKFLDANKSLEVKSELEEEMEVVEDVANLDADAPDPLEDHQPIQQRRRDDKPRSGGGGGYTAHKTPSPTLREKSKRSTKGKHSSEKFQNFCATKSSRATSHSPQKKTSSVCSSKLELQSFKNEPPPTTATTTTTTTTTPAVARKKPASCPVISPPIRAMLPPSSLYKVVETTVAQDGISTPPRKLLHEAGGETAAAVASPSLIVKFKKVRQAELTRLNGEAENFMFPRTRTSSDLPTDQDRQTTSENAASGSSAASVSLESSSEPAQAMEAKSEDRENNENIAEQQKAAPADNNDIANRHIVVAKRRKGRPPGSKTRFPSAPIQPGVFTLKSLLRTTTSPKKAKITAMATMTATTMTTTTTTTSSQSSKDDAHNASSSLKASACLTLPEATRKSSRTATAIVTAATTSSRLLRAAVEAAKNNQRLSNESSTSRRRNSVTPSSLIMEMIAATASNRKTVTPVATPTASPTKSASVARKQIKSRNSKTTKATAAVKLEDRMGEDSDDDSNEEEEEDTNEKDEYKKMKRFYADDDDDDDEDLDSDDEEDDDDDDEDYVSNFRGYQLKMQLPTLAASRQKRYSCMNNREQRATNRATKKCLIKQEVPSIPSSSDENDDDDDENIGNDNDIDDDDEDEDDADDRADDVNDKKQLQKSAFKSDDENDSDFLGCEVEEEVVVAPKPKRKYTKRSSKTDPITPKPPEQPKSKRGPKPKRKSSLIQCKAPISPRKTIQVAPHIAFDISKSERLQAHEYSFERVPVAELWYRVFQRQDKCEEKYFEYYGSTNYRKLPYELGPIPFNRTLDGISCKICGIGGGAEAADKKASSSAAAAEEKSKRSKGGKGVKEDLTPDTLNNCAKAVADATATATSTTTAPSSPTQCGGNASSSSNYTHKKLHLLQRYRREQQELLLKQQQLESSAADNSHGPATLIAMKIAASSSSIASKASTPDREAHERRAGSIHSNASSCASSIDTMCSKSFPRNKHLNKAAFLNLELPPRKSPREHASTLALVSCLKQRQNSQSKPNSEVDEPTGANTPIPPPLNCVEENTLTARKQQSTPPPLTTACETTSTAAAAPEHASELRCTRSAAGTPVEELRFTTEISENVKRLRRGQNKYDHSPLCNPTNRLDNVPPSSPARLDVAASATKLKRRIRQPNKYHSYTSGFTAAKGKKMKPSIRKTGQKKGVLEFEMDAAALKALDTTRQYTDPRLLEWQIDKYLEYAGRTEDFDEDEVEILASVTTKSEVKPATKDDSKPAAKSTKATTAASTPPTSTTAATTASATTTTTTTDIISTTPPTTDYFSSDFDLYDLFMSSPEIVPDTEKDSCSSEQQSKKGTVKSHPFSLYSSAALQNYFKKRKSLKSNRTGWPKVHKKKISARQQQQITDQIRFLPNVSAEQPTVAAAATLEVVKLEAKVAAESGEEQGSCGGGGKEQTPRQSVVITPPDSDTLADDDEDADGDEGEDEDEDEDEDDDDDDENGCKTADNETELDAAESIPEEEEEDYADTLAGDSVDDREADVEEDDDDDDDEDIADEDEVKAPERRERAKSDIEVAAENVNIRASREDDDVADDDVPVDDDEPAETDVPVEDEEPADDDVPVDEDDEPADEDVPVDDNEPAEDDVLADDDEPADDDGPADDDEPVDDEDDTLTNHEPPAKRMRRSTAVSPLEKLSISTHIPAATNASAQTSTPSTQLLRNLRRSTPHLNGSLGSCVSPIEKAGDNSDIFTVSSDGLDTDLDLSNSHSAIIKSGGAGEDHEAATTPCVNHTPKRKFDLAKYAANNSAAASSTCAAEAAATANAKSLAISQFLKKEVKVNCRRLRAPFRRFRYRR